VQFDPESDFDFDDFARLPILERRDLAAAGESVISGAVPADLRLRDATGGSTGQPLEYWTGPKERGWRESGTESFMRRLGVPAGSRAGLLWAHNLDPIASTRPADRLRDVARNRRWFECLRLSPEKLLAYHRELQDWRPTFLLAYAGALGALAQEIQRVGSTARYPTRACITGAEKLQPHDRQIAQAVFPAGVHERYGSRDVGDMGFQMEPSRTLAFEIDWANILVEPESTGGVSSILVTKLNADAMPFIRYRIGDIGRFSPDAHPGHPAFILEEIVGRQSDRIAIPDGTWVHGVLFPHLLKDYPIADFQVHQGADYGVTIRVVAKGNFTPDVEKEILRLASANLPGVPVLISVVDSIARTPAGKLRLVISEIPESGRA
jgi:phenylacetate-CoA ligase